MDQIDSYWSMQDDVNDASLPSSFSPSVGMQAHQLQRNDSSSTRNSQHQQQNNAMYSHQQQQQQQHQQQRGGAQTSSSLSSVNSNANSTGQQQLSPASSLPMDSSAYGLSPSALDPSSFSSQFILPRFASGGPGDAFGFGVAVAEATNPSNSGYKSPGAYVRTPGAPTPSLYSNMYSANGNSGVDTFTSGGVTYFNNVNNNMSSTSATIAPQTTFNNSMNPSTLNNATSRSSSTVNGNQSGSGLMNFDPSASNNSFSLSSAQLNGMQMQQQQQQQQQQQRNQSQQQQQQHYQQNTGQASAANVNSSSNGNYNHNNSRINTDASEGGPVYAPYGSSIISVDSNASSGYKLPAQSIALPPSQAPNASHKYDPAALGLPVPPASGTSNNFAGLYSSSGFDMLGVLARVAARPNPQLSIGAVDTSCAFLVVDAKRWDQPIVFASETFTRMTGFKNDEIIGKNCRFLQSPTATQQQGVPRRYTDGNAAWHMRTHIQAGKESQSSLINYKKDGKPFINLVTIIPIAWDSDEITYFVGFQVDLVDQPNAILDRMKDGTYVVNYSLYNNTGATSLPSNPTTVSMASIEEAGVGAEEEAETSAATNAETDDATWSMDYDQKPEVPSARRRSSMSAAAAASIGSLAPSKNQIETLDIVEREGLSGLQTEEDRRAFHKLLLSEADDFVHVLSLKGSFLYCSPSVASVLEYQPSDLIGKTLPTLCHPSDVVPVMRLLKDTSTIQNPTVSLLYRIRRKHSGYIWLEASGKLHIEPGKGRKCVIFVGRPREVMKMSWGDLRQAGGIGNTEFWMSLSPRGSILSATSTVESILGHGSEELVGTSLLHRAAPEHVPAIQQALRHCADGVASSVRYRLRNQLSTEFTDVVTRFYPRSVDEPEEPVVGSNYHCNILAQTNEVSSEQQKNEGPFANVSPVYGPVIGATSDNVFSPKSEVSSPGSSDQPAFQSTFKTLAHPSTVSDNVFDELESRRPTSWQFELHQLQITNKKLRDEKDHLIGVARKRGFVFGQRRPMPYASDAGSSMTTYSRRKSSSDGGSSKASAKSNGGRGCANCGRFDSPEWRAGPTGPKSLCNRCGLRWKKSDKEKSAAAASSTGGSVVSASPAAADKKSNQARRPSLSAVSSSSLSTSPSFTPYSSGDQDMMQW